MNLPLSESYTNQQRCRPWIPFLTQQLRLRHLKQVTAYNVIVDKPGQFYYTLHLTSMSAPFYTSEEIDSPNPKWTEVDLASVPSLSTTACVLRIWQARPNEMDKIILTWGINFSGLVYLGNKLADVQPSSFKDKAVILHLHGGIFTSIVTLRNDLQSYMPFIDHLNVVSTETETRVYRNLEIRIPLSDTKKSYCAEKLRRLQSLQISIKSKAFDVDLIKGKINQISGLYTTDNGDSPESPSPSTSSNSGSRYTSQLLTMTSLNKMLQEKPTKVQRKEIVRIRKEIEDVKFKVKMLSQERDRKQVYIRQLKQKYMKFCDDNEELDSKLMEDYRHLSRETEKLRECKKEQIHHREVLLEYTAQLHHRRRQLMAQLLELYPIECTNDQKCKINGVHLPNSELLNDSQYSGNDLAVALGSIAHILIMCSSFLQVPLRYPIIHMGSRSMIVDHITASLGDTTKQSYPLYLRGKERLQFNYAVCLLNKNIAQLRWICGLHTQNLKATLPNLLTLLLPSADYQHEISLSHTRNVAVENGHKTVQKCKSDEQGKKGCDSVYGSASSIPMSVSCFGSNHNISDPILDTLKLECQIERSYSPMFRLAKKPAQKNVKCPTHESGLSQILAIPEAFLNQQISPNSFKSYMSTCNTPGSSDVEASTSSRSDGLAKNTNEALQSSSLLCCDIIEGRCNNSKSNHGAIEQGKDLTDPSVCMNLDTKDSNSLDTSKIENANLLNHKRLSRSVGSYDEDKVDFYSSITLGSDPFLNSSGFHEKLHEEPPYASKDDERITVEKWLDNNKVEKKSQPDDLKVLERKTEGDGGNSPLTRRTDALLNTTSFHLVKSKYSD